MVRAIAHPGRLVTLAWCARLPFVSSDTECDGEPHHKGSKSYCSELATAYSLQANFETPFDPSQSDFVIDVMDIHLKEHTLRIRIDTGNYYEDGYPDIYINGNQTDYTDDNPNKDILVETKLDDGIDGVEKQIEVKVQDPDYEESMLSFLKKPRYHVYTFTVKQEPEYNLVTQANLIKLMDSSGQEIAAKMPFDATSGFSQYEYHMKETEACKEMTCPLTLQFGCPSVATGTKVDGKEIPPEQRGQALPIDMSSMARRVVSAACYYEDAKWTDQRRIRYYTLTLTRDVKFQGNVLVQMPGLQGICEKKLAGSEGAEQSFDCRSLVDDPKLIFHTSVHQAKMTLIDKTANTELKVHNGIPMSVPVPSSSDALQMKLVFGKDEHIYPVLLYKPALCSTLTCPEGQAVREPSQSAVEHLCHGEVCNVDDDAAMCCGDRAPCSTYAGVCLEHTCLRHDADETLCELTVCKDPDQAICCQTLARCDTYPGCPAHEGIRWDGKDIECAMDVCTPEKDHDTCCRPLAKCDTYDFPCPDGEALTANASVAECKSDKCTKDDLGVCCNPKATCDTFNGTMCPKGQVVRHDGDQVLCEGCTCKKEDAPVCCKNTVTCENFEFDCPSHLAMILTAAEVYCAGDVCTQEADTEKCCQARCEYFDSAKCPADQVMRHDLKHICNDGKGDKCTAEECCKPHALCDTFNFTCPEGTVLRHDSAEIQCKGDQCVLEDKDVCCKPKATCDAMPRVGCPEHTVPGSGLNAVQCSKDVCGEEDVERCCRPRATCDTWTFECPPSHAPKPNPEKLECWNDTCFEEDHKYCCGPKAICTTLLDCGEEKILNEDARSVPCHGFKCGDEDIATCCMDPATCMEFEDACPDGKSLAYRAAERHCRGTTCSAQDAEFCCLKRAPCTDFLDHYPAGCIAGQKLWKHGVCEQEECSEVDVEVCCMSQEQELEGLLRVTNIDFTRLKEAEMMNAFEESACAALKKQAGAGSQACESAVFGGLHEASADIMFQIDVHGVANEQKAAFMEALRNQEKVEQLLNAGLGEELAGFEVDSSKLAKVAFLAIAEGQVDGTHGGVYFPGILKSQEDGQWTVGFSDGEEEKEVDPSRLQTVGSSSEEFAPGDRVNVLVRLTQAAKWEEMGITKETLQWMDIQNSDGSGETMRAFKDSASGHAALAAARRRLGPASNGLAAAAVAACVAAMAIVMAGRRGARVSLTFVRSERADVAALLPHARVQDLED